MVKMVRMRRDLRVMWRVVPPADHLITWRDLIVSILAQFTANPYFIQMKIRAISQLYDCLELLDRAA
jgi:hypothetical protein